MNTIHTISGKTIASRDIFTGSSVLGEIFWKNLIIDKRISVGWLYRIYKHSPLRDFWSVLSSAVN